MLTIQLKVSKVKAKNLKWMCCLRTIKIKKWWGRRKRRRLKLSYKTTVNCRWKLRNALKNQSLPQRKLIIQIHLKVCRWKLLRSKIEYRVRNQWKAELSRKKVMMTFLLKVTKMRSSKLAIKGKTAWRSQLIWMTPLILCKKQGKKKLRNERWFSGGSKLLKIREVI